MKIIISPAKKMVDGSDLAAAREKPVFLKETKEVIAYLRSLSDKELKMLWKCNDKIAALNIDRLRYMDVDRAISPAVFSFDGIQYQYMAPVVMSDAAEGYIQEHLRILSGFYGVLKPFDAVASYRLEMEAIAHVSGEKTLYDFWLIENSVTLLFPKECRVLSLPSAISKHFFMICSIASQRRTC